MICKKINKICCDDISLIENYDKAINDDTQTWDCHHRREIDENKPMQQLKNEKLYYNRPASELIFLTKKEHQRLHMLNLNEEIRRKILESNKRKRKKKTKNIRIKQKEKRKRLPLDKFIHLFLEKI